MKKKLNIESITNELEGASLFFTKSTTPPSLPKSEKQVFENFVNPARNTPTPTIPGSTNNQAQTEENQEQKRTNVLSYGRTDVRTNERTNAKPKRQKIRHAFDIYKDQLISLQIRQLQAVQSGRRKPRLGKMVQEAIDNYLQKLENKRNSA